ncbi:MAG: ribokinase [Candidatus Adiutrix sp.]
MSDIIVIGSLNMDMVVSVPKIPSLGETVLGEDLKYVCGGKGANQALTASRLGGDVCLLGSVGLDANGEKLLANLEEGGVQVKFVQRLAHSKSGLAFIAVDGEGNNNIIVAPLANLSTDVAYIQRNQSLIKTAKAVMMQLEIPLSAVKEAAALAKGAGVLTVLDPAPAQTLEADLYANIDIIKPNEGELATLTGKTVTTIKEAETAAHQLLDLGVGLVVVTLGGAGALMVGPSFTKHVPTLATVKVIDTTAAGDSFVGAMTTYLVKGYSPEEAIDFAMEVAAIVVSRPGAQSSIPTISEMLLYKG